MPSISRRDLVLSAVTLGAAATVTRTGAQSSGSATLVAYLSRSGNTRVIAGQISRALDTDLFEIRAAKLYPEDYEEMVAQAERERQTGLEPALAETVANLTAYDTLFLGFPIWGMTAPSVVRSFLSSHDLRGKRLIPFITHGGYGVGSSLDVVARHSPGATLIAGLVMEADQERRTMETVSAWLASVPAG